MDFFLKVVLLTVFCFSLGVMGGGRPSPKPRPRPKPRPVPPTCGKVQVRTSRVIGGKTAVEGAWPWQAMVMNRYERFFCGGSLLNKDWVVTAAECVEGKRLDGFKIILGLHDYNDPKNEEVFNAQSIRIHENYNNISKVNNIALIKLTSPVDYNKYISNVCLPKTSSSAGKSCFVTGWGPKDRPVTGTDGSYQTLQQAQMRIVDHNTCYNLNTAKSNLTPVTKNMLCAGNGPNNAQSTCHGDMGGPLVCNNKGAWELHGIAMWSSPSCDAKEAYSVFTKVTAYKPWIQSKTGIRSDQPLPLLDLDDFEIDMNVF